MIKALIFDMDNTLIDRQKAFKEGINEILHRYFDDEEKIQTMLEDVMILDKNGTVERIDMFKVLVKKYNIDYPSPEQLDLDWKGMSGKKCYLFEDVRETLSILKDKYKIAILSNGQQLTQRRKLDYINIYDLIDYSLVSSEYICSKPDSRIFVYTCEQLGCKPEECVYVGDNYKVDILGSLNAGLLPIYVNRVNDNQQDVRNIKEIRELLNIF